MSKEFRDLNVNILHVLRSVPCVEYMNIKSQHKCIGEQPEKEAGLISKQTDYNYCMFKFKFWDVSAQPLIGLRFHVTQLIKKTYKQLKKLNIETSWFGLSNLYQISL